MTKPTDPYSRLYWRLIDDAKFVEVYPHDAHLALYVRLLLTADMAWPASASLPYGTKRASLQKLADVGLVDILPSGRYRIHGLDKERGKRQQKASNAAGARWDDDGVATASEWDELPHPPSSANGVLPHPTSSAYGMPSRAKPSRAEKEPSRALSAREGLPHITPAVQAAGEAIAGAGVMSAGDKQLTELDRLCEAHGEGAVIDAMQAVADGGPMSWRQLVWGAMKHVEPIPDRPRRPSEADEIAALAKRTQREYEEAHRE